MKTIIAGSRGITVIRLVRQAVLESKFEITEVVSGAARGVDTLGEQFAKESGIPVTRFPADWTRYGRSAGPIRNRAMAEYADALIAITTGSRGTASMIALAESHGLRVFVLKIDN